MKLRYNPIQPLIVMALIMLIAALGKYIGS